MADLRYQAEIDVKGAQQALESLKNTVFNVSSAIAGAFAIRGITGLSAEFENLRTSLQILYRDAATGGKAFDEIKKFAATSVFSVQDLTETVIKLKAAGLEPTVALLRLFADTSSVAADSVGALKAITDLYARTTAGGLGLEDLNRLADRGIPVFDILSKKLGVSRLEISKIGQTAEGANLILRALEEGLTETFGGASAARAGTLSQSMSNLGDAFANAVDKIGQSGLNKALGEFLSAITDIINKNQQLFEQIGNVLGKAFSFLAENINLVTKAAIALFTVLSVAAVARLAKAFVLLGQVIVATPLGRIAALAALAVGAFVDLGDSGEAASKKLDALAESEGTKVIKDGKLSEGTKNFKEQAMALNQELQKFRVEMENISKEFAKYNNNTIAQIELETRLIGTTKEYSEVERARAELVKRSKDEIDKLELAKKKLTQAERKEGRAEIIDAQIKQINELTDADLQRTEAAIKASEARQMLRKVEEYAINNQISMENELQNLRDNMAKSTMSELEQKYYDIEAAAKRSAKAQIDAERIRIGRPLSAAEQKAYYDEAVKGTEDLKRATKEQYDESRKFATGWKQAFNEYADNATNAANRAREIFQKVTSGMEDMIVNFAKTGKFEWKGFLNSIVEDLLRSQIRQLMSQVFGSFGGGTISSSGFLGSLLGFANGGVIPTNGPVLVGEKGPELISGAAGRTVTPNGGFGTNVTYNISAVDAMSFKEMIAKDPSFIYAVSQQGSKGIPVRR